MIELRQLIDPILLAVHPKLYFHSASSSIQYPYLVYDIEIYDLGEGLQLVTLEIDGWDKRKDTTTLETLLSSINNAINKQTLTADNFAVTFYLDRILPLSDEKDPLINRRRYIYEGRLYQRE